ncbi:MAG TPA: DUF11 domain-containing protein [Gemmataceae bacterium]|jgi:uncharacterized repeat protein (TIGR01451 family)|nr:DUF11 domain-containing protein [Gemmataceae bacterium]
MLALGAVAGLPLAGMAQTAHPPAPSPLLYVRFAVPAATQVTVYPGGPGGRQYTGPVVVGFRPGYIYRVKLANLVDHPYAALFPSLEVRGTLQLPPNLRAANYPAPVVLSEEDIQRALAGGLVTKVIYLENPEHAFGIAARPDLPIETEVRATVDPLDEARLMGRPVLIIRLGGRTLSEQEVTGQAVPGTILLPGDKMLGPPALPPYVPWACWPVYDPIAGPKPATEECLRDGGDAGLPAGLDAEGRLHGLDPADTVAVYADSKGGKHVAVSNPVCICVPRFAVIRTLTLPLDYNVLQSPGDTMKIQGQFVMRTKVPPIETRQNEQLLAMVAPQRLSGTENSVGTIPIERLEGLAFLYGRYGEKAVTGVVVQKTPVPPDRPLLLRKWSDKQAALIGEVVTFHLKFTNQGGQPITGITVSDSLTGRLEYVPGSASTDRQAIFTMQENEAGSLVLQWQIGGALLPGQSGEVVFQARVR